MSGKSGVETLRERAGLTVAEKKPPTFADMLTRMRPEFEKVLPKFMSAERLMRIALTEVRKNPDLGTCDPQSLLGSLMMGAQLGLEPGVMGQAYLVPYNGRKAGKKICQFIPGWKGYVDLISRSGRAIVETRAVYEGDEFWYRYGTSPKIHHAEDPAAAADRKLLAVYATGQVFGAPRPLFEVWGMPKVLAHRSRYNRQGDRHYSYRDSHNLEMYARKVVLLQLMKYLPTSVEVATATSLEYAAEAGTQRLTIEAVANDEPLEIEAEPAEEPAAVAPLEMDENGNPVYFK